MQSLLAILIPIRRSSCSAPFQPCLHHDLHHTPSPNPPGGLRAMHDLGGSSGKTVLLRSLPRFTEVHPFTLYLLLCDVPADGDLDSWYGPSLPLPQATPPPREVCSAQGATFMCQTLLSSRLPLRLPSPSLVPFPGSSRPPTSSSSLSSNCPSTRCTHPKSRCFNARASEYIYTTARRSGADARVTFASFSQISSGCAASATSGYYE